MRPEEKMFFNFEDISRMFGVTTETVRKWQRAGKIRCAYIGGRYWMSRQDLDHFFQSRIGIKLAGKRQS